MTTESSIYFVIINKTGSTSLKKWLGMSKKPYICHQFRYGKEVLRRDIKSFKSSFKFISVVRNPYSRAVSSWKFISKEILAKKMSFVEFLNYNPNQLTRKERKFFRFHIIPQYNYISGEDKSIDYLDHIGKLENINDTLNYIIQNGYNDLKIDKFPHKNRTKHKHYSEYYDDEAREIVEEKYAKDIEHFSYEFGE